MKIGIATPAFKTSIERMFQQNIEVVYDPNRSVLYDLVIFSGGEDIHPMLYGKKITYSVGINAKRDDHEKRVYAICAKNHINMFGICRGHQLINAIKGGHLVQDIYLELNQVHGGIHPLEKPSGIIKKSFKEVNSLHHQGVIKSGSGLSATSFYGTCIESTEGKEIITVQWHPEFMLDEQTEVFVNLLREWVENSINKKPNNIKKLSPESVDIIFDKYFTSSTSNDDTSSTADY